MSADADMAPDSSEVVAAPVAGPVVFPAGPVPRDVWPLVWGYLPMRDLVCASHTCRGWRADVLEISRLWAQLDLHAYDANDGPGATPPTYSTAETLSNIRLLDHILPRSKLQLITLDVEIRAAATDDKFGCNLTDFLEVLSPRLAVLRMKTGDPTFPGTSLWCHEEFLSFPALRVLDFSPSAALRNRHWPLGFRGEDMPNLRHCALHGDFRFYSCYSEWLTLESLHCTVDSIIDIEHLLLSASGLQQLRCECRPSDPYGHTDLQWPNQPIFDALSRIPDVHVSAVLEPYSVDWVFDFFVNPPRPRLLVEFHVDEDEGFHLLNLKACAQFASANRLTMRRDDSGGSIIIEPDDSSGRFFQVVVNGLPSDDINISIDWELVPPLDALTALRVDATLWPDVMYDFPQAPLLANVTLVLRPGEDIVDLLRDGIAAQVPRGATLTLTTEPVAVTRGQVTDLTAALGVKELSMTGNVEIASLCRLDVD